MKARKSGPRKRSFDHGCRTVPGMDHTSGSGPGLLCELPDDQAMGRLESASISQASEWKNSDRQSIIVESDRGEELILIYAVSSIASTLSFSLVDLALSDFRISESFDRSNERIISKRSIFKMVRNKLLLAVTMLMGLSIIAPLSEAQLFRRWVPVQRQAAICQGPQCQPTTTYLLAPAQDCPPLVVSSNVSQDDLEKFEPVSETNAQWFRSAARMIAGNSCGSGSVVGFMDESTLLLTNAHVVGTRPGSQATVRMMVNGKDTSYTGQIVMAAYSDKTLADWAIVRVPGRIPVEPRKLSTKKPSGDHVTVGSPRCVWPLVFSALKTVNASDNSALWRWNPNAIGGQSGSGVWSVLDGNQYGLLTWSWGGYGAGQQTWWIYQQAKQRSAEVGELRPAGLVELGQRSRDVIVEEGFFMQANIGDLPIWDNGSEPVDPVDPVDPKPCPNIDAESKKKLQEALKLIQEILADTAA
jgi:hypothetical protein